MITLEDLRNLLELFSRPEKPDKIEEFIEQNSTIKSLYQIFLVYEPLPAFSDERVPFEKLINELYIYSKEEVDAPGLLNHIWEQIEEFRAENPDK